MFGLSAANDVPIKDADATETNRARRKMLQRCFIEGRARVFILVSLPECVFQKLEAAIVSGVNSPVKCELSKLDEATENHSIAI